MRLAGAPARLGASPAGASSRRARLQVVASAAGVKTYKPVPRMHGELPLIGHMLRVPLDEIFAHVEAEFAARPGLPALDLMFYAKSAICLRHPADVAALGRDTATWAKSPGLRNIDRWLGRGLVTEFDAARHAQARDMLAPAFRAQSVKDLVPIFAAVGQELADLLLSRHGQPTELEQLTRRATLDVIGRAGFGYDFKALQRAQSQLDAAAAGGGAGSSNGGGAPAPAALDSSDASYIDVVKVYEDILSPAMLLIFGLPLPNWAVPGYQRYLAGVERLEQVVAQVLQERRSAGVSPCDRSLLAFMLQAQQADPAGFVDDRHIRDQLMTFLLAGSDTTATTLAFALHELAQRPDTLAAVQAEVGRALGDTPVGELQPDAFSRLPLLTGAINETLRLFPAAPGLARVATRDYVTAGGEHLLPAGTLAVGEFYSLHRHPDFWPRPYEWLPERWLPANAASLGPRDPEAFMPFHVGPRACIGRYFGMLEMQVILSVMLRQLSLSPEPGRPAAVPLMQAFTLKSRGGVHVVPRRRAA